MTAGPRGLTLGEELGHAAGAADYLRLAWRAASPATLAGALGSLIESGLTVREAAYGYRPSDAAKDVR